MPRPMLRLAVLSAALLMTPAMSYVANAADEPSPPPREGSRGDRPQQPDNRPRDGRPGEGRPGEGRTGEGRPGEGRPGPDARQPGRMDPEAMLQRVETVLAELDLSAEQKTKVDQAVATAKKSLAAQKESEARQRMQASMEALGDLRRDVESTLTEDQKRQFAEKMPARGGRPGNAPGGPGGPGGPDARGAALNNALTAALEKADLTADQKAKVKEAFFAEMQKLRDAGGRPDGGRPDGARPDGARPQGDRPQGDRPPGDRPRGDRPDGDRPGADRPEGDRRPPGDRPAGERPRPPQPDRQ